MDPPQFWGSKKWSKSGQKVVNFCPIFGPKSGQEMVKKWYRFYRLLVSKLEGNVIKKWSRSGQEVVKKWSKKWSKKWLFWALRDPFACIAIHGLVQIWVLGGPFFDPLFFRFLGNLFLRILEFSGGQKKGVKK